MALSRRRLLPLLTAIFLLIVTLYAYIHPSFLFPKPHREHGHKHHSENPGYNAVNGSENDSLWRLFSEDHIYREPRRQYFHWTITTALLAPDGITKRAYLINGQFPGPTIEARSGDELSIEVLNLANDEDGIAIHWHGLSMRGANEMDGLIGLTQCAIGKGKSFRYNFVIEDEQAGTFWYHAHSGRQRVDGLYGALIVHKPADVSLPEPQKYGYDEEQVLLISDWYHKPASDVLDSNISLKDQGTKLEPDSILINGQGYSDCSQAMFADSVQGKNVSSPDLSLRGRLIRLRIINTGASAGYTVSFTGYALQVITVDGGNHVEVASMSRSVGILYPGERVDIIIVPFSDGIAGQEPAMSVTLDTEKIDAPALVQHFSINHASHRREKRQSSDYMNTVIASTDLAKLYGPPFSASDSLPEDADETFVLNVKTEYLSDAGMPQGLINRTSWGNVSSRKPPLLAIDRSSRNKVRILPEVELLEDEYKWVDIVINNMDMQGHDFHLHGNSFYVLASHALETESIEPFNPFQNTPLAGGPLNTVDPVTKDTVFIPGTGYVVLRLKADNKGLWFLQSQTLWGQAIGVATALQIGDVEANANATELCNT